MTEVIVWPDGVKFPRLGPPKGKTVREITPGDEVVYHARGHVVTAVEVFR